ncbi:MAG: DNA repair protein RecN [Pseudomonadota bacterium]
MLQSLTVKNLAIIDEVTIEFERGFNVLTGETGAGKTILIQAINLVLGGRIRGDMIRSGCEFAEVTALFTLDDSPLAKRALNALGCEVDDEVMIKRYIDKDGKGKRFINGQAVTVGMLRQVAETLVDISSQHEHQLLLDPEHHLNILDAAGVDEKILKEYQRAFTAYQGVRTKLNEARGEEERLKEQLDFMKFQLDELDKANLKPDELDELERERNKLKHAVDLAKTSSEVDRRLYSGANSIISSLSISASDLSRLEDVEELFKNFRERLDNCLIELKDVAGDLQRYVRSIDAEPGRLDALDDRIHLIRSLARKYGGSVESCIEKHKILKEKVGLITNFESEIARLEEELSYNSKELETAGTMLSKMRREYALDLEKRVEEELRELSMERARFVVSFEKRELGLWDRQGPEKGEFYLTPNQGEAIKPLKDIASGGELSRIMLAIKSVVGASSEVVGSFIFDEVDSGIGGEVAGNVGKKLAQIAKSKQVICITHLPQIASEAGHHYMVSKSVKNKRTLASIVKLSRSQRVEELARMLGGSVRSDALMEHVDSLID